MGSIDESILRTSKEIVVKFIEMGRISPVTFSENFKNVYHTVDETVKANQGGPKGSASENGRSTSGGDGKNTLLEKKKRGKQR